MSRNHSEELIRHFLESAYDFDIIWKNLENCHSRGFHIYDDQTNRMVYYPYSEIYTKAGLCAAGLQKRGIKKGDYVLLSAQTDIRFAIVWVALIWLGAIPATLPPRTAFLAREIYLHRIKEIVSFFENYICYENEISYVEEICASRQHEMNLIVIQDLCAEIEDNRNGPAVRNNPSYDDAAFVQFTSGSMSVPKGIIITFRNILNNLWAIFTRLDINPEKVCIGSWLPLFHDMGLVGNFLLGLFTQSTLVMVSHIFFIKRVFDFLRMISTYNIGFCCMTNTVMEIILHRFREDRCKDVRLDTLKWLGVGAEPINITTLERFQALFREYGLKENVISPCYGLAESALAVSIAKPYEGYTVNTINGHSYPTSGPVIEGTSVLLVKDENYDGPGGIIKIKGNSVSTYSLVNGKKIKRTDEAGYYDTQDLGYFDADKLVILGRADTMFIVHGENFFSHEIESLLIDSRLLQRPNVICIALSPPQSSTNTTELIVVYEVNRITRDEKRKLDEELAKIIMKNTGLQIDKFIAARRGTILYTTSGKIQYNAMKKLYIRGEVEDYYVENP